MGREAVRADESIALEKIAAASGQAAGYRCRAGRSAEWNLRSNRKSPRGYRTPQPCYLAGVPRAVPSVDTRGPGAKCTNPFTLVPSEKNPTKSPRSLMPLMIVPITPDRKSVGLGK